LFKKNKSELFNLLEKGNNKYIFEYEVPVCVDYGKGRASCTDLIIENEKSCYAIEAKRTEPKYETVEKWKGNSKNKEKVLDWWLNLIEETTSVKIEQQDVN